MGHGEPRAGSGRDATVHAGIILASSSYCQVKSMSRVRADDILAGSADSRDVQSSARWF